MAGADFETEEDGVKWKFSYAASRLATHWLVGLPADVSCVIEVLV